MTTHVDRAAKIQKFIDDVITPATNAFEVGREAIPGGQGPIPNILSHCDEFRITPNDFNTIAPRGGQLTASALADIFQYYAYILTSCRRATISRYGGGVISTDKVTTLNSNYRMNFAAFKSAVTASPNPLDNLQPGNPAASAALDALIARLASIVTTQRNMAPVNVTICHGCHSSRGRR